MKKATLSLTYVLFAVTALYPVGLLICTLVKYKFQLTNVTAFSIITGLLSIGAVVLSFVSKERNESKISIILPTLMLPLSLINAFLYPLMSNSYLALVCVTVTFACALFLVMGHGRHWGIQITILLVSVFLSLPIGFCSCFGMAFGNIGYVEVVQTVESPCGKYRAEVLDVNQGALGGDTVVNVYENSKHFDLLIFTVSKKPQTVYMGPWGEFEDMKLHWKDDQCLVINSVEHEIE